MILDNKYSLCLVVLAHAGLLHGVMSTPSASRLPEPMLLQAMPLSQGEPAPELSKAAAPVAKPKVKPVTAAKTPVKTAANPVIAKAKPSRVAPTPERTSTMMVAAAEKTTPATESQTADAVSQSRPAAQSSAGAHGQSAEVVDSVTEPSFHANYLNNPKPPYPPQSLALGEKGVVMLRVQVSAAGSAETVSLQQSSGYPRLDRVAQITVTQWRFVPAKRGQDAVAGTVIVPVHFSIKKS
ncbi:energy transducer TonB [Deefgea piscis]|uniref:Energy transducer TonB n=1 Tax=Deefgea piscis TaxID=2739061 RepID=A0A6M8SP63_9NEIS|nr:energy transducer TonB [Deefgea piscis]QKJ67062.1 energy transducer TonB [Deefgea piscis]